jgi:opacity protein-like surface antigen
LRKKQKVMAPKNASSCVLLAVILAGTPAIAQQSAKPLPPRPLPPSTVPSSNSSSPATYSTPESGAKEIVDDGAQPVPSSSAPGRLGVAPAAQPEPKPYRLTAAPRRPRNGWSIGAFGGANISQTGEDAELGGNPVDYDSQVKPVGGIKIGYTWPFDSEPIDQFEEEFPSGLRLGGGVELEAFYLGNQLNISDGGVLSEEIEADSIVTSANFLLKAQIDRFRLYAGPGVGVAYVSLQDNQFAKSLGQDDSDEGVVLVWQIMAGLDYFLASDWSLFGEYKFFNYYDYNFYSGAAEVDISQYENHLLNFGVRYHF